MSDTFPIEPNYLKELEEEFPDQVKQVYDDKNNARRQSIHNHIRSNPW